MVILSLAMEISIRITLLLYCVCRQYYSYLCK
nr:MAG TPA: SCIMP protein [Caudoviricetes sp.]